MDIFANAKSIALLKSCTTSSPYLSRLAMELAQYDFTLYHIDGTLNIVPDALSRMNKSHDDIISQDKTNNNAITKQKSLCLVEFLKLPTNYRFTPAKIKTMLTSEPLKTQIDKKKYQKSFHSPHQTHLLNMQRKRQNDRQNCPASQNITHLPTITSNP